MYCHVKYIVFFRVAFVGNDQLLKQLNDDWDNIAPYLLNYNDTLPLNQHKEVAEKIRKYYLGSKPIDSNTSLSVTHMIGDRMFGVDFQKAVILHAKINKSPVWTYYYSYRSMHSFSEIVSGGSTKNFGKLPYNLEIMVLVKFNIIITSYYYTIYFRA